ncbi:DUF4886 domain-containing protein [Pseudopedobacter beijingensis]|uniref:DUF4886 domain-containing protein n=1 Tax=Pseudopedobacter beijingensis TaxID=1207056 RepID=A0ABW4IAB0_9SPHI
MNFLMKTHLNPTSTRKKSKLTFLMTLLTMAVIFISCSKKQSEETMPLPDMAQPPQVSLNAEAVKLQTGQMAIVYATFPEEQQNLDYTWRIEDASIADIDVLKKDSVKIRALSVGTTRLYLESADKSITKNVGITVTAQGTIKLLCIGNSYADDTVVRNLYELAQEQGIDLLIEVIYQGGTSLLDHWNNLQSNKAYSCYRIEKGVTTRPSQTFKEALAKEHWDYISIQQLSRYSGKYDSYEAQLPPILDFLKKNATNPDVKYVLHQTWANQADFISTVFEQYYGSDQSRMYREIAATSKKVYENFGFDVLVPTGTSIQNARTSAIGDFYTRDGYHLQLSYGRYTGACAYFQALFGNLYGLDIRQSKYKNNSSDFEAQVGREAAYQAVLNPYAITELTAYQEVPVSPILSFDKIKISFSGTSTTYPDWNFMTSLASGSLLDLHDITGGETSVKLKMVKGFKGNNSQGPATTTTALDMPSVVSKNSFFHEGSGTSSIVEISGLNKDKRYKFVFFVSSANAVAPDDINRETQFELTGNGTSTAVLESSRNTTNVASIAEMQPDKDGTVSIRFSASPNNTQANKYYYACAMAIEEVK